MDTWIITATDTDTGERGKIAVLHTERGVALAAGCSAILDGWADVTVSGSFRSYDLKDVA